MTIETKIDELIAALNANTAAQGGKTVSTGTSTSAGTTTTKETKEKPAGKTKPAAYEPQHSKAEAQALANKVKDEKGVETIRGLIKKLGYDKLADISKAEDLDKLYDACQAELGEDDGDDAGGDDDGI